MWFLRSAGKGIHRRAPPRWPRRHLPSHCRAGLPYSEPLPSGQCCPVSFHLGSPTVTTVALCLMPTRSITTRSPSPRRQPTSTSTTGSCVFAFQHAPFGTARVHFILSFLLFGRINNVDRLSQTVETIDNFYHLCLQWWYGTNK